MLILPVDLRDPLTEDDVEALSSLERDGLRFEIDNGRLILTAPRSLWHSNICVRIANLRPHAYGRQGLRITRTTVRCPDVLAFYSRPNPDASCHDPADVALVAEVVSPDTAVEDRLVKARLYAGAGIPEYWIVDRHPADPRDAVAECFKIGAAGVYEGAGQAVLSELEAKGYRPVGL
ncbi:Uma2 family endonuclease [Phytohabitans flavus]|uniref:Uma2 family endonuclease n=1 Tax=Phytohabitans flavus TaxID=1076124 RepID=UPI003624F7C1